MHSDATYAAAESNSDSESGIDTDLSCPWSLLWPDQEPGAVLDTVLPLEKPGVTNEMVIQHNMIQHYAQHKEM